MNASSQRMSSKRETEIHSLASSHLASRFPPRIYKLLHFFFFFFFWRERKCGSRKNRAATISKCSAGVRVLSVLYYRLRKSTRRIRHVTNYVIRAGDRSSYMPTVTSVLLFSEFRGLKCKLDRAHRAVRSDRELVERVKLFGTRVAYTIYIRFNYTNDKSKLSSFTK